MEPVTFVGGPYVPRRLAQLRSEAAPARSPAHGFAGGSVLPATFAAFAAGVGAGAAGRPRAVARRAEGSKGRSLRIENQISVAREIQYGDVDSMDKFMRENAAQVCLQNLEKIEKKQGAAEVMVCYLQPTDMGPYRTQMKMEVKVEVLPGSCVLHILDMHAGQVDKKTGEVTFDPEHKVQQKAENVVTWTDNGRGGLEVVNRSWSKSKMGLPWWFPLPDKVVEQTAKFVIGQVIKDGVKKVNEQIEEKYLDFSALVEA
ncbi:unnamed protein product [Effrenium voratum]|uniref:Uncharacterized protein n=1 Tax=Effrenium voratum TaxID=2562239 RepID=A0AA36I9S4_9DINO|nr:unnamed protein product [Effrenium voratum]